MTLSVECAQPQKRTSRAVILAANGELGELIEKVSARYGREGRSVGAIARFRLELLRVLNWVGVHGITDVGRWVVARLSPIHRVARFTLRRRTRRFYRESQK